MKKDIPEITVTIAGPSGSGKTAVATLLQDALLKAGVTTVYSNLEEAAEQRLVQCSTRLESMRRSGVIVSIEESNLEVPLDEEGLKRAFLRAAAADALLEKRPTQRGYFVAVVRPALMSRTQEFLESIQSALSFKVVAPGEPRSRTAIRGTTVVGYYVDPAAEVDAELKTMINRATSFTRSALANAVVPLPNEPKPMGVKVPKRSPSVGDDDDDSED